MRTVGRDDEPISAGEQVGSRPGRSSMLRVLVVDDDAATREHIARRLVAEGIDVIEAADGASARTQFQQHRPHLVVLDLVLPDATGLELLSELRRSSDVPVILLSGLGEEADRVAGLELGADDYVVKPFSPRELLARIRSVMRRYQAPVVSTPELVFGDLRIDPGSRTVHVAGAAVALRRLEFDLLLFLASSPRQAFSRAQLLEQVWGSDSAWQDESTVTEHIHRIRQRMERDSHGSVHIVTVRGFGYRFEP